MRAVPAMHEKVAQDHQTEEAIGSDSAYCHFKDVNGEQSSDDRGQEHLYSGGDMYLRGGI